MIFITVGSQKFQFNRLLIMVDELVDEGIIKDTIYAQTGYSDYKPKNFHFKQFLTRHEFLESISQSECIVTHGGTGAIISALKEEKAVIAVPRELRFKEHVDDHQKEIVTMFESLGFIDSATNQKKLKQLFLKENYSKKQFISNSDGYIDFLTDFFNES